MSDRLKISGQFIKRRKWWFGPPHQGHFDILTMMGREWSRLPTTPQSPSRHYYPRLIAGTNLLTPKGWIAWLAKADCTRITFCPRLLHNWIQRLRKEINPGCRLQDQLNTSEPTAVRKAREINLWTCWAIGKSNPGPFTRAASGLTTGPVGYIGPAGLSDR